MLHGPYGGVRLTRGNVKPLLIVSPTPSAKLRASRSFDHASRLDNFFLLPLLSLALSDIWMPNAEAKRPNRRRGSTIFDCVCLCHLDLTVKDLVNYLQEPLPTPKCHK